MNNPQLVVFGKINTMMKAYSNMIPLVLGSVKIEIQSIPSKQQKADILMKALTKQNHEESRKLSMGMVGSTDLLSEDESHDIITETADADRWE
jgi:hypothetical protein